MVARQHAALNTDDFLAYFCGSIVGAWFSDHLVRLLIESWKGQIVRAVNNMPLLPFDWSSKVKLASGLPSNWYSVLVIGVGVGGLLLFIWRKNLLRRTHLLVAAFIATWCVFGAFRKLFPPPFSREQVPTFGFSGYFAEVFNSMLGWALIWLLVYGFSNFFLLAARRIRA